VIDCIPKPDHTIGAVFVTIYVMITAVRTFIIDS